MNNRKLIDYLPPVLKSVADIKIINDAMQTVIERAWEDLKLIIDEQFIESATEESIEIWEKELGLYRYDADTLDVRKNRIKSVLFYKAMYTYRWLLDWLKSFGDTGSNVRIEDYTVHIDLPNSYDCVKVLEDMLRNLPANLLISPVVILTDNYTALYIGSSGLRIFNVKSKIKIKTDIGYAYPKIRKCGTYPAQLF